MSGAEFMHCFKRSLLAAVAAIGFGSVASAADLPVKAPIRTAVAPEVFSWNGFYIGANAGYAWNRSDFSTNIDTGNGFFIPGSLAFIGGLGTGSGSGSGFVGGVQGGYNVQWNQIVLGIEADFDALRGTTSLYGAGTTLLGTAVTLSNSIKPKWMATVRPRIGYAFDRTLVYATGGLAILQSDYNQTFTTGPNAGAGNTTNSSTKAGWVLGGGLEYGLSRNWSIKAEYLYARFTGLSVSGTVVPAAGFTNTMSGSANFTTQNLRAGVNYHF